MYIVSSFSCRNFNSVSYFSEIDYCCLNKSVVEVPTQTGKSYFKNDVSLPVLESEIIFSIFSHTQKFV